MDAAPIITTPSHRTGLHIQRRPNDAGQQHIPGNVWWLYPMAFHINYMRRDREGFADALMRPALR